MHFLELVLSQDFCRRFIIWSLYILTFSHGKRHLPNIEPGTAMTDRYEDYLEDKETLL